MADEWNQTPLTELIEFTRDGEWGTDQPGVDRVEMLVIRGTDFARLRIGELAEIPRRYISREAAERKALRADDVLIETAGGTKDQSTGRTALVKRSHLQRAGLPVTCASFARLLRFNRDKVEPAFMYWWLQHLHACGEMEMHQVQHTGVARFQFTKFAKTKKAPLPLLPEQRAIARILGTLDDKIELNRRMSETLEAMARALFQSWFVDFDPVRAKMEGRWRRGESLPGLPSHLYDVFPDRLVDSELGEIPEGWCVKPLGDLIQTVKGRSYKSEELVECDTALVTLKSFARGGGYRPDGLKPFAGTYKPEQVIQPGEIVIACTDVTQAAEVIGRPAMVRRSTRHQRLVASLDTLIVRPKNSRMTRSFAYLLFSTETFTEHTYAHTTGTTVLHLAKEAVPSFRFPLPPESLVRAFDRPAAPTLARIQDADCESETLAALRDTLLPKLISGALRVKDAEKFIGRAV